MTRFTHGLGIDPGGAHVGVVLADLTGPEPAPIDGLTIDRRIDGGEAYKFHMGGPKFVRRSVEAIFAFLDKHNVADEQLFVAVETLVPPTPAMSGGVVPRAIWSPTANAQAVLGAVSAMWPDAWLVAPKKHDLRIDCPDVLKGRRPKDWSESGSERQHQRAAWSVLLTGLAMHAKWRPAVPAPLDAAVAILRREGRATPAALISAARSAMPDGTDEQLADLAARAAAIVWPERTSDVAGLRALLIARLHDQVA